ncbi:MAG: hypothetical protein ABSF14_09670 [Terriglobia bacterium]
MRNSITKRKASFTVLSLAKGLAGIGIQELVATTSVLLVVGFWKDFDLEGHSTSTNPRQIAKRICRGYHVPRGKPVAQSWFVTLRLFDGS